MPDETHIDPILKRELVMQATYMLVNAILDNDYDRAETAIENQADLNARIYLGKIPLELAIDKEFFHIAKLIHSHVHPQVHENDVLYSAIEESNYAKAKFAIYLGADRSSINFEGRTFMSIAQEKANKDIVDLLKRNLIVQSAISHHISETLRSGLTFKHQPETINTAYPKTKGKQNQNLALYLANASLIAASINGVTSAALGCTSLFTYHAQLMPPSIAIGISAAVLFSLSLIAYNSAKNSDKAIS